MHQKPLTKPAIKEKKPNTNQTTSPRNRIVGAGQQDALTSAFKNPLLLGVGQLGAPLTPSVFTQQLHRGALVAKTLGYKMRPVFLIFNCVGVQFDGVPLTAGRRRAAPSGCPRAGTSAGRPKKNPRGEALLSGSRCCNSKPGSGGADIPVYNVTVSRAKDTSFLLIYRWSSSTLPLFFWSLHFTRLDRQTLFR